MTTVAVTGCSGYVGRKVCELLEAADGVGRVVGIDVRDPSFSTGNLEFYRLDVRSPDLATVVDGCDAIVHLAAVNTRDASETEDVIVGGMRNVTRAAAQTGARKLVFTSAADVYGSHRGADPVLTEESPVRPGPHGYGAANAEAEEIARAFAFENRDAVVTVLRLAAVFGPSMPIAPGQAGNSMQAIHEDDAARAVLHFLDADLPGTFNVCAADTVDVRAEVSGHSVQQLVERVVVPPSRAGVVMSNERLLSAGFEPAHSSADAVRTGAEAHRGWVSVRGVRFRPQWIAAAAGTIAAFAITSAARGLRARRARA